MMHRIRKAMDERDQGFTLIELLVVIIIIGILAAIAIPVFLNQRKKGIDAGVKADLKNAATAAETIATDNPSATTFDADGAGPITVAGTFTAAGFKKVPDNIIEVKGSPAAGFCVRGINDKGSATGATVAFWYDSIAGGLQGGNAGAAPFNGACAAAGVYVALN